MPKSDNQKAKILYILDYLEKYSHEEHPVRASELIAMLERDHNISCERKTIYSDIATLQDFGVDIITLPGKNGGYYIGYRNFEPYELKLLIDAVQSSRYLTQGKSQELIEKLCKQCNIHDASLLKRDVLVSGRVKSMNESIYFSVDTIQNAMAENKQIAFRYFDWDIGGKRIYRDKNYTASPYGLLQDSENYYLLGYSERHGTTSYRVDRMAEISILEEKRQPCPELTGKSLYKHANQTFQMFQGTPTDVKLRFHKSLVNVVIDKFGKDLMMIPDGEEYFNFTVRVAVSPTFLSWVIGFGLKAKVLYPQSVADACKALCLEAMSHY